MSRKELASDHIWNLYQATKMLGLTDQEKDFVMFLFVLKIRGYLSDSRKALEGSWDKNLIVSKNISTNETLLLNQIIKYFNERSIINSLYKYKFEFESIVRIVESINLLTYSTSFSTCPKKRY